MKKDEAIERLAFFAEVISKIKGEGAEYEFLKNMPKTALKFAEANRMGMVRECIGFIEGALWVGGYLKLNSLRVKNVK